MPFNPGIVMYALACASSASALPNCTFNASAWLFNTPRPIRISCVIFSPPKGITAVCFKIPSLKTAKSEVPPPISRIATPASMSISLITALADANGCNTKSLVLKPLLSTALLMLRMAFLSPVMI